MFVCAYSQFFKKRGVVGVEDEYQLFNQVTGLNLCGHGEEFLAQVIILVDAFSFSPSSCSSLVEIFFIL